MHGLNINNFKINDAILEKVIEDIQWGKRCAGLDRHAGKHHALPGKELVVKGKKKLLL